MYTSGSIVSSGEDRVLFSWYFMRSMVVIQYSQCPVAVMSACGLDVKANFVPKIDIVGLVRIVLLDGRDPCFWRSLRCSSGAGWDKFGAAICYSNLSRLCLKLSHVFCSSFGSQVGFHETSTISLFWKWIRLSFSFWFRLIQAGQAHESLASIASLSVALQQLVLSKHCQW